MLTLRDLINPKILDQKSNISLLDYELLKNIKLEDILKETQEYINVLDYSGTVVGAIKTERLRYLIAKQNEIAFINVIDNLDKGIVIIDSESRIFYINQAYSRILGVHPSRILGRYLSSIEPEAALLEVLHTGKSNNEDNILIKSIGKYVSINAYPIISDGEIIGAYSVFTDVTQLNELNDKVKKMSEITDEYNTENAARKYLEENEILGESKAWLDCVNKAIKVASADTVVLIRGENGSGKEVIRNIIQKNCSRKNKPILSINCSAIPESLFESELFGYEDGSFTGAVKGGKLGKFQLADGGILFLDEIGDIPFHLQAKLLRVLQEGEIEKIGRQRSIPVNVRVIAATNKPLEEMVRNGRFREDLYYRLNVITLEVPPLRERGNDIVLLAEHFLKKYCRKYRRSLRFDRSVYQALLKYSWPGNVRELKNSVESAVVLCDGNIIGLKDLTTSDRYSINQYSSLSECKEVVHVDKLPLRTMREEVADFKKDLIARALEEYDGKIEKVLEALDISRRTFYRDLPKKTLK